MSYQSPPPNQPNDFVVLVALVGGLYLTVPLWEFVKPLVVRFLHAYQHTLGPGMTGFLDLISPLALYALVVALIIGVLEGVLFPMIRQIFAEWSFARWLKVIFKPSEGGAGWSLLGVIFVVLFIIGVLSDSP